VERRGKLCVIYTAMEQYVPPAIAGFLSDELPPIPAAGIKKMYSTKPHHKNCTCQAESLLYLTHDAMRPAVRGEVLL
jgi:hypothetical protein